jgi:hypothetical protein
MFWFLPLYSCLALAVRCEADRWLNRPALIAYLRIVKLSLQILAVRLALWCMALTQEDTED